MQTRTQTLTRDAMDYLVGSHFRAEIDAKIPEILTTFTEDVEHDIVGRGEPLHGWQATGALYTQLLRDLAIEQITPVHRYYGDDFLVDESIVSGRAIGTVAGMEGRGRKVRFQLLHILEFRCRLATLEPPPPEMQQLMAALAGNQPDTDRFLGTIAGTVPIAEFYAPGNIQRVLAAAGNRARVA